MPSITRSVENQRKKLAKDHNLENVLWPQTVTTASLSPLDRRWFGFFIAIAKMGFCGVHTSIGKLTIEEHRVNGQTRSERTTYRSLASLEQKKIIHRKTFRMGSDKFSTIIYFNLEAFSFYLQSRSRNVSPLPIGTYTSTPLPSWQEDKRSSIDASLPPNCCSTLLKQQNKCQKKIASYLLPLLTTIRVICRGARSIAIRRLEQELETGDYVSGVDHQYWSDRWRQFDHERRDSTAEREIVPALLSPTYGKKSRQCRDVDALVDAFVNPVKPIAPNDSIREVKEPVQRPRPPDLLSEEEREILELARQQAQARQRAG